MTTPNQTGFFSNEPQVVQGVVLWVLTQVGALVLGHTSLVTSQQWSSLTTGLVPILSLIVIGAITLVWRRWLTPAWKVIQTDINRMPFGPEIEKIVAAQVEAYLSQIEGRLPGQGTHAVVEAVAEDVPVDQVDGTPSVGIPAPGEYNGTAQAG